MKPVSFNNMMATAEKQKRESDALAAAIEFEYQQAQREKRDPLNPTTHLSMPPPPIGGKRTHKSRKNRRTKRTHRKRKTLRKRSHRKQ